MDNWPDHSGYIKPYEFEHPSFLSPKLIRALGKTRQTIGPIYLTKGRSGPRHPNGDAVPPDSTSHNTHSLHKWGYDHIARKPASGHYGLAQDCDFNDTTIDDLFQTYLAIEALNIWSGIGIYPFWHNKGFHLDLRPASHTNWGARWWQDKDGTYHNLTWTHFKGIL